MSSSSLTPPQSSNTSTSTKWRSVAPPPSPSPPSQSPQTNDNKIDINNYRNVPAFAQLFSAAADATTDAAAAAEKEDFMADNEVVVVESFASMNKAKSAVLAPVYGLSKIDVRKVSENQPVDRWIERMAGYSLPNYFIDVTRGKMKSTRDTIVATTDGNQTSISFDDIATAAASAADSAENSASAAASSAEAAAAAAAASSDKPTLFDSMGNVVNSDGSNPNDEKARVVCVKDQNGGPTNAYFRQDAALIKEYIFKTFILLLTFCTVYNWCHLFFSVDAGDRQQAGEDDAALDADGCSKKGRQLPGLSALLGEKNMAAVNSVPFLRYFIEGPGYTTFMMFNPLMYVIRFTETMFYIVQEIGLFARNETFGIDKKMWFLLFLYVAFQCNQWFFGHASQGLLDIYHTKGNTATSLIYLLFIWFWIESFITDPVTTKTHTAMLIFLIGIIYVLLFNIYLFFIMGFNSFASLFVLIIGYGFISFNALWATPSVSSPFSRFDELCKAIAKSGDASREACKTQLPTDPNTGEATWSMEYLKYVLVYASHIVYDHAFFYVFLGWLMICASVFYSKLKVVNLQHNMLSMVMFVATALVFFRIAHETLFPATNNKIAPAPAAAMT